MSQEKQDYYMIMTVPRNSTDEEIQRQYRRLAKIYHPDRNPGEEAWCSDQLRRLNDAYHVLSNPTLRAEYDRQLEQLSTRRHSNSGSGPDYATTGDGRSVYTRWRPDVVSVEQANANESVSVSHATTAQVRSERGRKHDFVVAISALVVIGGGLVAVAAHFLLTPPPPKPYVAPDQEFKHAAVRQSVSSTDDGSVRPVIHHHAHHAASELTPAEKDARAERLAEEIEAQNHSH